MEGKEHRVWICIVINREDVDLQDQGSIWWNETWKAAVMPEKYSSVNEAYLWRWSVEREGSSSPICVVEEYLRGL